MPCVQIDSKSNNNNKQRARNPRIKKIAESDLNVSVLLRNDIDIVDLPVGECIELPLGLENETDIAINEPAIKFQDETSSNTSDAVLPWDAETSSYRILQHGIYEFEAQVTVTSITSLPEVYDIYVSEMANIEIILEQFNPVTGESYPLSIGGGGGYAFNANMPTTPPLRQRRSDFSNTVDIFFKSTTRPEDANNELFPLNEFLQVGNHVRILLKRTPFFESENWDIVNVSGILPLEYADSKCSNNRRLGVELCAPSTTFNGKRILSTGTFPLECNGKRSSVKGCGIKNQTCHRSDLNVSVTKAGPTPEIENIPLYHCVNYVYGSNATDTLFDEGILYDVDRNPCKLKLGPQPSLTTRSAACAIVDANTDKDNNDSDVCNCNACNNGDSDNCNALYLGAWEKYYNGYQIFDEGVYLFKIQSSLALQVTPEGVSDGNLAGVNISFILNALDPTTGVTRTLSLTGNSLTFPMDALEYLRTRQFRFLTKTGTGPYDLRVGEIVSVYFQLTSIEKVEGGEALITIGGNRLGCGSDPDDFFMYGNTAFFSAERLSA